MTELLDWITWITTELTELLKVQCYSKLFGCLREKTVVNEARENNL